MIRIAPLDARRAFTAQEITEILPTLMRITAQAEKRVSALTSRYGDMTERDPEQLVLEHQVMDVVRAWGLKIMKLGGKPLGIWEVGFPAESGTASHQWKYPAGEIRAHGRRQGEPGDAEGPGRDPQPPRSRAGRRSQRPR